MITIYLCNVKHIIAQKENWFYHMPEKRKAAISSLRHENDQLLCLAAGILIDQILGPDAESQFIYNSYGKPFLSGGKSFNLSHAGQYAVLAVSQSMDNILGIDLEIHENGLDVRSLADISFHTEEINRLAAAQDIVQMFFDLWTLKESYIKYLGTGFSLPPKTFSIALDGSCGAYLESASEIQSTPALPYSSRENFCKMQEVHFTRIRVLPGYSMAVCCHQPEPIEIKELNVVSPTYNDIVPYNGGLLQP